MLAAHEFRLSLPIQIAKFIGCILFGAAILWLRSNVKGVVATGDLIFFGAWFLLVVWSFATDTYLVAFDSEGRVTLKTWLSTHRFPESDIQAASFEYARRGGKSLKLIAAGKVFRIPAQVDRIDELLKHLETLGAAKP